jgi:hypothetical protein
MKRRSEFHFPEAAGTAQSFPPFRRRFAGLICASRFLWSAAIGASPARDPQMMPTIT